MRVPAMVFCGWIVIALLLAGAASWGEETVQIPSLRIALLNFEDRAGFQGDWDLATDIPALIGRYLATENQLTVISRERVAAVLQNKELRQQTGMIQAVRVGRLLEADLVVSGIVEQFGVRRTTAGDPNLAGYKSYKSVVNLVEIELIRVATEEVVRTFDVFRDSTERPLGLDLFGRPRQQDRDFRELFKVEFASDRFFELPFGQLVAVALKELSADIVRTIVDRPPIDLSSPKAVVLAVEVNDVYLGIGTEDHVEHGDFLPLYKEGGRVALVEVNQIIGSHLCKARIVEGAAEIETGLRIGQRLSRQELETNDKGN
jgi:hypothetical protein